MVTVYDLISTKEFRSAKPVIPERELLVATLDRAVLDYYGTNSEISSEASEWIFSDEIADEDEIFSFRWICDHLSIEPNEVRERINNLSFPKSISQAHRWLRSKVQSKTTVMDRLMIMEQQAA